MPKKSLDEILYAAKTHRCISPILIRRAAGGLMESSIGSLVIMKDEKTGKEDYWQNGLIRHMKRLSPYSTYENYSDIVKTMLANICISNAPETFLFLTAIAMEPPHRRGPWFKLSAEDVLREAGMEEIWEVFYKADAKLWEEHTGYAPSVGEILGCCFKLYEKADEHIHVCPALEQYHTYGKRRPAKPFFRYISEYPLSDEHARRYYCGSDKGRYYSHQNAKLFAVWVWYLMIIAPARLWDKETLNAQVLDIVFTKDTKEGK